MKKTLFDKLYAAGEAVVQGMQKPVRIRMLKRAAERVSDELESTIIKSEISRGQLEHSLANASNEDEAICFYRRLANLDREIEEGKALVQSVKLQHEKLFQLVESDEDPTSGEAK